MPVVPALDLKMLLSLAHKEYSDEDDNAELFLKPPTTKAENYTAMNRLSAIVFEQTVKTHASKTRGCCAPFRTAMRAVF